MIVLSVERIRVWFLWLIAGFGPFALFNGLWCEEPYLELYDMTGASVGAYIGGLANASMILLLLLFLFNRFVRKLGDVPVSALALVLGVVGAAMLAFRQSRTESGFLWASSFLAGACGNVCVFTLFSFASKFNDECTSALGVGLNMSGILIAALGLLQRPGLEEHMTFSFSVMMLICAGIGVLSLASLLWLNWYELPRIQHRRRVTETTHSDETAALLKPTSVNSVAPAVPLLRSGRHLLRVVLSPCAAGLISSVCAYFFNPGLVPFLSAHSDVLSGLIFAYMVASTLGAFATVKVIRNLWPIVYFIAANLLYSCAVASQSHVPMPEWVLYVTTINLGFFNAYVTTVNFLVSDAHARDDGRNDADAHTARGYVAVANQIGVIAGSYACFAAAAGGAFEAKQSHQG
jgi:Na+/melibiose symporter-like transporter